jgi:hypothetical protein
MKRGIRSASGLGALLATVGAVAGCGSSSSGSTDPATLVPASAPLYASVAIKPSGGSGGAAIVAAKKLTHLVEPYGSLAQALLASTGGKPNFKSEISSWAGERAGVFVTSLNVSKVPTSTSLQSLLQGGLSSLPSALGAGSFGSQGAQGAIVLQTSDVSGARSFLHKRASEQHAQTTAYKGISLEVSPSGVASGIVKNFAVVGSESGVHAVVDTSLGGAAITAATGYTKAAADAIATVYAKPEALTGAIGGFAKAHKEPETGTAGSSGVTGQGLSLLGQLFAGAQTVSLTASASENSLTLQGQIDSAGATTPLFGPEGAKALGELPGTSWLAAGVGDTGANLPRAFALLQGVASFGTSTVLSSFGGASIEKLFTALDSPKAKLQQDFGSWAGAGGMFVSGSSLFNLQARLVIASKNPTESRAAVNKLASLIRQGGATVANASIPGTDAAVSVKLQGFPAVIFIADGAGKFVLGVGQQSVEGAISPSATLSTSPSYSTATTTLGGGIEPSLIVEFPTLLGFLESVGLAQSPGVSNLIPYLKSLGTLTAGATSQGGVQRFKVVLGLA